MTKKARGVRWGGSQDCLTCWCTHHACRGISGESMTITKPHRCELVITIPFSQKSWNQALGLSTDKHEWEVTAHQ
jgi:hypothetical protein